MSETTSLPQSQIKSYLRLIFTKIIVVGVLMSAIGHAKVSKIQFPTEDGIKLNARIYEPDNAKAAPAILLIEGSGK